MQDLTEHMQDLSVVYYTANYLDDRNPFFLNNTRKVLLDAIGETPLITVSQKPIDFGQNICVGDIGRSHTNIYRQALIGAKAAKTKYIAMAEDDVLYPAEHFKKRPNQGVFAYNKSVWSIYTWVKPPILSYKDRRVLNALICERELFIEAMEERFKKYPTEEGLFLGNWAEPGKYEDNLGVTQRKTEVFYTNTALVAFSHETALAFLNLGKRKKLGDLRVTGLPYWGSAHDIYAMYEL